MVKILYEDAQLAVCLKPVGVSSQDVPDGLPALVRAQLSCGEIFTVHRLDQIVSGVMVVAKTADAAAKLSQQMQTGLFHKEYLAVCRGKMEQQTAELSDFLYHERAKNKTYPVKKSRPGAKAARLRYRVLAEAADKDGTLSLLHVQLFTGRTHQIRAQLAARKHPLVGDGKYGGADNRCACALFSFRLTFRHPVTGKTLTFRHERPEGFPWDLFQEVDI